MRIASALAIALFPAATFAQSATGTIDGTLGREEASWVVSDIDGAPASSWRQTEDGTVVELHAYPATDPETAENAFILTFTSPGGATMGEPRDAMAELRRPGEPPLTARGENLDLQLTTQSLHGDSLAVAGDLSATFTVGEADQLIIDPAGDATTFEGNFQATVIRAE